ncbi:MAG: excinuclease ABC subunit UvrC [Ruminococcaceae bacterium]|nr:excinuclease ABC subunit UvrC [Oscillospiraceae bacterium]
MNEKQKELKSAANRLPTTPGVYIMKDKSGKIIYIGKAKALKNRVTQYFGSGNNHTEKVRQMVMNVDHFETILCDSEFEALILENSLIKQNQPKYNILLKDDKGYHYIHITDDRWKRIETAMQLGEKGEYIGPYYSAFVVRDTVETVRRTFRLPDCNRNFDTPSKPCLNYHIGLCEAPCKGKISLYDYNETVNAARDFIKKGNSEEMINSLSKRMEQAAENLEFELAARLRDRITAMRKLKEKQKVVMAPYPREDVFACAAIGETACVSVLIFKDSRLSDKQHYFIDGFSDKPSLYAEFLQQYYETHSDIPPRIVIDESPENEELLEQWLSEKSGKKSNFILPERGVQRELVAMCRDNAAQNLSMKTERSGREMAALNELAELLGMKNVPRYIESYDISHTAGQENVGGMIVFKDGRPFKAAYKRFKIKGFVGQDDYASMAQVLDRRFTEYENGEDEGFGHLPDLILLDGGKGQLSAVREVLSRHNISVPVFGMVKDSKHRTRAIACDGGDISIKQNRRAFTLVTAIQDEVHRFAITYHRQKRSKNMLSGELLSIEGVGKSRANALLKHFKTIKKIREASVEELTAVKGVTKPCAEAIYNFYRCNDK